MKINWNSNAVAHKHFKDLGEYVVELNPVKLSEFDEVLGALNKQNDYFKPACTATVKKNAKGEVIVGRNMDVEISQEPAYIGHITEAKYETVTFSYTGVSGRYNYDQLAQLDEDEEYCKMLPFMATDAFNETGLFIEANMRESDTEFNLYSDSTNPGKKRACMLSIPALVAANCSTVEETLDFLRESYDWYTLGFAHGGSQDSIYYWNLACVIGDATGNYGLVEFGRNGIYYVPYANGQANYYISPELAEYAVNGTGYGRFSAALKGLPSCETARDMLDNMKSCMWKKELLEPGSLGYSDQEPNVSLRRTTPAAEMQRQMEEKFTPLQPLLKAFYAGDEQGLRSNGSVWTTSFNFGVNCAEKYLILRFWEKDSVILEWQW